MVNSEYHRHEYWRHHTRLETKEQARELTNKILDMKEEGKTQEEIVVALGISKHKYAALVKRHKDKMAYTAISKKKSSNSGLSKEEFLKIMKPITK